MTQQANGFTIANPFKNGSKGKEYSLVFSVPHDIIKPSLAGLEDCGLSSSYNRETKEFHIKGVPTKSGEFEIRLDYQISEARKPDDPTPSQTFKIYINPDPRDLWKNIPTDTTVEYYKPDSDSSEIRSGERFLVGASQRGRSHAHEGKPRDDDFAIDYLNKTGWYIQIVADGAGSAPYSREGSRIACKTALNCICYNLEKLTQKVITASHETKETKKFVKVRDICGSLLIYATNLAKDKIIDEANRHGRKAREYATTLLVALTKKFDFGWLVVSFGIGDGAMAAYGTTNGEKIVKVLGKPDEGEFGGQTRFITMNELYPPKSNGQYVVTELKKIIDARVNLNIFSQLDCVMLMTDGISDAKFETSANLDKPAKWEELWAEINASAALDHENAECKNQLLQWLDFWSVGNHDDRTITILF